MKLFRVPKALLPIVLLIVLGLIFVYHHHQHKLIPYTKDNVKEFHIRPKADLHAKRFQNRNNKPHVQIDDQPPKNDIIIEPGVQESYDLDNKQNTADRQAGDIQQDVNNQVKNPQLDQSSLLQLPNMKPEVLKQTTPSQSDVQQQNLPKQSGISQENIANQAIISQQQNNLNQPEVLVQNNPNTPLDIIPQNVPNQGQQLQYFVPNQPGVVLSQPDIPQQNVLNLNQQGQQQQPLLSNNLGLQQKLGQPQLILPNNLPQQQVQQQVQQGPFSLNNLDVPQQQVQNVFNQYGQRVQPTDFQNKQVVQNQNQGGTPIYQLPSREQVGTMDYTTMAAAYHRYVNTKQTTCKHMIRLGNIKDGGWDICDDVEYRPRINNCIVFSFGINNDFSFDDAIALKYGCQVHCFDPSMKRADHRRSDKIYFHATGLSGQNSMHNNWPLKTFSTIRQELNYTGKPIDVVKIDIEMWELKAIPEMVTSGSLKDVKQFVVEIHVDLSEGRVLPTREKYESAMDSLRYLYADGFRLYYAHKNPFAFMKMYHGKDKRYGCHEMSFVRL